MNADLRQRLVRRLDVLFFAGLLITAGLAAVLFWTQFYDGTETSTVAANSTASFTPVPTRTASVPFTATVTYTATHTPTDTPTNTPTATATETPTLTATATATPSRTPSSTPSNTPSPSLTSSPDLTGTALAVFYLTQVALAAIPSSTPTPTLTATITPLPTPTVFPSETATLSPTPWPTPQVVPLALAQTYAGEPLLMTGLAQPGDTIQLHDQDQVIASATTDESGTWVLELPEGLPEGPHSLSVVAISAGGAASLPVPVGFQVGNAPTPIPTATPTLTPSFTPTPSPTPTVPTATHTHPPPTLVAVVPTLTPSLTRTPSPTPLPPLATRTASSTTTPVPTGTFTPVPTMTVPSATPSVTHTPLPPMTTAEPTHTPTRAPTVSEPTTPVPPARPRIDTPAEGTVVSPGKLTVRGVARPGVAVEVWNAETEAVLASVEVPPGGAWEAVIELAGEGQIVLVAAAPGPDGVPVTSDPVTIMLAPPVQPVSGGVQSADPGESGRAFTALLALLLAAGGFSTYFAGRLVYLLAHDRLKPR